MSPSRALRARRRGTAAPAALDARVEELLAGAVRRDKHALGRLISLVEEDGAAARTRRAALFRRLAAIRPAAAPVIGITGAPGSGKSSLIGRVCLALLALDPALGVAVVAIDPSSARSGGALLGDRLRTQFPVGEPRLFFRSQATRGDVGGMSRRTYAVTRLLRRVFDLVLIETVGIGQSEIDVSHLSDLTVLVMQPLAGDHVQFMKAGVMEVPDVFVVNKCDEEGLARRSAQELRAALGTVAIAAPVEPRIFETSATTGHGIAALAEFLRDEARRPPTTERERARAVFFLRKSVAERYGRFGLEHLEPLLAARPDGVDEAAVEELEEAALEAIGARLRPSPEPSR
jgi:LAO/AO transport system kinase